MLHSTRNIYRTNQPRPLGILLIQDGSERTERVSKKMAEGSLLAIPYCFRDHVTCYVPGISLVIIFNGEKTLVRYCRTVVSEKLNYFLGVQIVERERKIERAKEREKTRGVSPRFFPLFRSLYFSLALFFARAPLSERLEQAIS